MPLKNGMPFCVNHPGIALTRNEGFSALTEFKRHGPTGAFDPTRGVPVAVYYCPECGYIEMYAAQKTPSWSEGAIPGVGRLSSTLAFEQTVLEVMASGRTPFEGAAISSNVSLGNTRRMADALVRSNKGV